MPVIYIGQDDYNKIVTLGYVPKDFVNKAVKKELEHIESKKDK